MLPFDPEEVDTDDIGLLHNSDIVMHAAVSAVIGIIMGLIAIAALLLYN